MPYNIIKEGNEYIVKGPKKNHGRHKTRKKAEAQMKALYANMSPEEKGMRLKGEGTREKT